MLSSLGPRATAQNPEEYEEVPGVAAGVPIEQPIAFSHEIHAGQLGMDCAYCHVGVNEGPVATIPAVQTCMGCHSLVLGNNEAGKAEIAKLTEYWENKQPIPWIKVHDLADHARFDHSRHVEAGLDCATCHGPVEEMSVITLQQTLNMGFCVDCHKSRLNTEENPTSMDCATCHK